MLHPVEDLGPFFRGGGIFLGGVLYYTHIPILVQLVTVFGGERLIYRVNTHVLFIVATGNTFWKLMIIDIPILGARGQKTIL